MSGKRAIIESLILILVVAGANALFGASDPGWLSLNPTPYILVPILVGMRYGFLSGLIGGVLAAAVVACGAAFFSEASFREVLSSHGFTLFALVTIGFIAGEVYRKIFSRSELFERQASSLEGDVERLRADLALANESQGQLQEQLALRGARFSSVDLELGRLFEPGAGSVLAGSLSALDELCDVGSSAIYTVGANNRLELEHAHGDSESFPAILEGDAAAIALAALESGRLATPRDMVDGAVPSGKYLAALPWPRSDNGRVLVIGEMSFAAVNWQNFARVEVFCRWVAETERARGEGGAVTVLDDSSLKDRIDLAGETVAQQGLPSTLVLFTAAAGVIGTVDQASLQNAILPELAGAEVAGTVGRDDAHLAVLLPMGGVREADRLVVAAGVSLAGERFVIRSAESADEIWKTITDVA